MARFRDSELLVGGAARKRVHAGGVVSCGRVAAQSPRIADPAGPVLDVPACGGYGGGAAASETGGCAGVGEGLGADLVWWRCGGVCGAGCCVWKGGRETCGG